MSRQLERIKHGVGHTNGVHILGAEAVADIDYNPEAAQMIRDTIGIFNNRNAQQKRGSELVVKEDVELSEVVLCLSKAYLALYGRADIASIDLAEATVSDTNTAIVSKKLGKRTMNGVVGFAFLMMDERLTGPQYERAQALCVKLSELAVPTMTVSSPEHEGEFVNYHWLPRHESIAVPERMIEAPLDMARF
ncbi:MAG TPA: hypothetical protein VH234_05330 [Candidatus Saccharimonadales bacterium]|jgi:hypothetical protein|nr:hypothetical protein [Candidatus Saccharimonadales bacterium]